MYLIYLKLRQHLKYLLNHLCLKNLKCPMYLMTVNFLRYLLNLLIH
jgi:hypothetical protein